MITLTKTTLEQTIISLSCNRQFIRKITGFRINNKNPQMTVTSIEKVRCTSKRNKKTNK